MTIEAPVAFLPGVCALTSKLFAKVFTNKWMRIEVSRIARILPGKESCPP
jgi:hypothetical protein